MSRVIGHATTPGLHLSKEQWLEVYEDVAALDHPWLGARMVLVGGPGPIRDGLDTWQHRKGGLDGTHGARDCPAGGRS